MRFSIWLLPAAPDGPALDAAIAAHAAAAGKATFGAHLTLASGPADAPPDLTALAAFAPPSLGRDGVLATMSFTRVYALRFAPSPELLALRAAARAALGDPPEDAPFDPHLSLTYGPVADVAPLHAIAARFPGPIQFDRVCLLAHGAVETQDHVRGWTVGTPIPLAG